MPFTEPPPTRLRRGGRGFLVDEYLAALPDAERAGALVWLRSGASPAEVAEKFTAEGLCLSTAAVRNWRRANPS